jgi:hypothetical protein
MKKKQQQSEQPKFDPRKEPYSEHGGEGLEEYSSDDPNFSISKKQLKKRNKK